MSFCGFLCGRTFKKLDPDFTAIMLKYLLPAKGVEGWEDNIKMDLQEVGGSCGNWMELVQDRDRWLDLVGTVMNFLVP